MPAHHRLRPSRRSIFNTSLACVATLTTAIVSIAPAVDAAVIPDGDDAATEFGVAATDAHLVIGDAPTRLDVTGHQMVVLDDVEDHAHLALRSRNQGTWSEWQELEAEGGDRPDGTAGAEGTDDRTIAVGPVWIGDDADLIEVKVADGHTEHVRVELLDVLSGDVADPYASDSPYGTARRAFARGAAASSTPFVIPRSGWATSAMTWQSQYDGCDDAPTLNDDIRAMVVHHTAGTNGYSREAVPGILRGIWYYHAQTRGWCDIAYNFLVDRFGRIWEGRQGGIDRPIRGGHTFGHNSETAGVAQLGHYDNATAPWAMTDATAELVGWKLALHGVDPAGRTVLTNSASRATPKGLGAGESVDVPTVLGHRDLGSTTCPGASTYARLRDVRSIAAIGAHTAAMHRVFLDAQPDADDYANHVHVARASGLAAAAHDHAYSDAYAGLFVDDLYRRALGRPADGSGRSYWVEVLRGGARVQDVGTSFYGSAEYVARQGSDAEFVASLYENLLHRAPDASGLAYWTEQLLLGRAAPPDVAFGFYRSIESRRDRVTRVYEWVLGRAPDDGGRDYWAELLLSSGDLTIATHLAVSDEFYARNLR